MAKKSFIDVYYDDEVSPPCWMVRFGYKEKGYTVVEDAVCASSKKDAERMAKQYKLKRVI